MPFMEVVRTCANCSYWIQNVPYRLLHPQEGACLANEAKRAGRKYLKFPKKKGSETCEKWRQR